MHMSALITETHARRFKRALSLVVLMLIALPAAAQYGLSISSDVDFSSMNRLFVDGETIYLKVEPKANLETDAVIESEFRLDPVGDGEEYVGTLSIQEDGTFTGSVGVNDLVGSSSAWILNIAIRDEFSHEYVARTAIVIRGRTDRPDVFRVSGTVESASATEIVLAGRSIAVTSETQLHSRNDLNVEDLAGHHVVVIVAKREDDSLAALQIFVTAEQAARISFVGQIETVGEASVFIRGMRFGVNDRTVIKSGAEAELSLEDLEPHMWALVEAQRTDAGWVATSLTVRARGADDENDGEVGRSAITGRIEVVGHGFIEVAGLRVELSDRTEIDGAAGLSDLEVGMEVDVTFVITVLGQVVAIRIEVGAEAGEDDDESEIIEVNGLVTAIGDGSITVEGIEFRLTSDTRIVDETGSAFAFADLATGIHVEVVGISQADGTIIARAVRIEREQRRRVVLRGEIVAKSGQTVTIGETKFSVTGETEIYGEHGARLSFDDLQVGFFALAQLEKVGDGSLTAVRIKVKRPYEDDDVKVTGHVRAVSSTSITVHGHTFVVTENTVIEDRKGDEITIAEIEVGMLAQVEGEFDESGSLVATEIKVRLYLHHEGRMAGLVTTIEDGLIAVNGITFRVTTDTMLRGAESHLDVSVGVRVLVHFRVLGDGTRLALRIRVTGETDSDAELRGVIGEIAGDAVVVAGVEVKVTATTQIKDRDGETASKAALEIGQSVEVEGVTEAGGILASKVEVEDALVIAGSVRTRASASIQVAGDELILTDETLVLARNGAALSVEDVRAGMFVEVIAVGSSEGAGKNDASMSAERVLVLENSEATGADGDVVMPATFTLGQNYPNPFNPSTTIAFELEAETAGHVSLVVFNVLGQKVITLLDGAMHAGQHAISWHGLDDVGRPVGSGVYLYRLRVGEKTATRTMTLMK